MNQQSSNLILSIFWFVISISLVSTALFNFFDNIPDHDSEAFIGLQDFLDRGLSVDQTFRHIVISLTYQDSTEIVKEFVTRFSSDLNVIFTENRVSPLNFAVFMRNEELIRFLLAQGANANMIGGVWEDGRQ